MSMAMPKEKPYGCPGCTASFDSIAELDTHRKDHHGWRNYDARTHEHRLEDLENAVRILIEEVAQLKKSREP